MTPGAAELVGGGAGLMALGAAVLRLGQVWLEKRKPPSERKVDAAQAAALLVKAASDAAEVHMQGMRQDFDALRDAMRLQAEEMDALRRSHSECETRCERLTAEMERLREAYAAPHPALLLPLADPEVLP